MENQFQINENVILKVLDKTSDRGAWQAMVHRVAKIKTQLSD